MEELLAAAAAAMKMSEKMVQRSAEAKAKAAGVSVESILAEWAGVEAPTAATPAAPEPPPNPAAADPPPTRLPGEPAMSMPTFVFFSRTVPVTSVPIRLAEITLPVDPGPSISA